MKAALAIFLIAIAAPAQLATTPQELVLAREALSAKEYAQARTLFAAYEHAHPADGRGALGLGDADLAEHQYEQAEIDYRRAVAVQPQLWLAHKQLVLVEARLHRWDEFDRERALLRSARQRGAEGITARESDLIDSLEVHGETWLVREYFLPMGRSEARYNFEHFTPEGRVAEYLSLEPTAAAQGALPRKDRVRIGSDTAPSSSSAFSLNWYTAHGHGTVRKYPQGEPRYETLRADVVSYLNRQKQAARPATDRLPR